MATKVVFAGSRPLGHFVLSYLSKLDDIQIVGCAVKDFGQDRWWKDDPWDLACGRYQLVDNFNDLDFDLGISVNYWEKISSLVLDDCGLGFVNIHHSYMLNIRGRNIVTHAIRNNSCSKIFGTTLHYMNEKIDRGPIICSRECLIDDTDTAKNLYEKADGLAKEIFIKWLPIITHKKIQNLPLPAKTAAYHNKNGIKNNVDMGAAKKDIYDQVRSLEFNDFFEPPYLETSVGKEYLTISPSLGYETLLECGGSRAVYKRVWNPPLKTR